MKIYSAGMAPITDPTNHIGKFRAVTREAGSDDSVNLSPSALKLANGPDAQKTKLAGAIATFEFEGKTMTFNNTSGAITLDGKAVNLKGIADPLAERGLVFQKASNGNINVFRGSGDTVGFQLDINTLKAVTDSDGTLARADGTLTNATRVIISNSNIDISAAQDGSAFLNTGGSGNDIIINRQLGGSVDGGAGDDTIFNFAKTVGALKGGAGNDAIYSVGLSGGTIDTGSEAADGYVKLTSAMTGGSISMGAGNNIIDASGVTISGAAISDTGGGAATSSSILVANGLSGGTVSLNAANVGVDVGSLDSVLTFGSGKNSLMADTVKKDATITSTGSDTFQFGTVTGATIDSSGAGASTSSVINITGGAKDATFDFGSGVNTLNAAGKTLTSVNISDAGAGAATAVLAGAITGTASQKSTINLNSGHADGSGVAVTGAMNFTDVTIGDGKGEVSAGSMNTTTLNMGAGGNSAQTIAVKGNAAATTITTADGADSISIGGSLLNGSSITTGAGADNIDIKGHATNATIDMSGAGVNTLAVGLTTNNMTYTGGDDADNIELKGATTNSTFDLGTGANVFKAEKDNKGQVLSNVSITAGGTDGTTVTGGAYTAGAANNEIKLEGAGANTVSLGSITAAKGQVADVTLGNGTTTAAQTLNVTGVANALNYTGADGIDSLSIGGALTNSTIGVGAGDNTLTVGKNSTALTYTGGAGEDVIEIGGALANSSITAGDGDNSLKVDRGGTNVGYTGGAAKDTLSFGGAVANSTFGLGDGENSLTAELNGVGQALTNVAISATGSTTADKTSVTAGVYTAGATNKRITLEGAGKNFLELNGVKGSAVNVADIVLGGTANNEEQSLTVHGASNYMKYTGSNGADSVVLEGATTNSTFGLGAGANSLTAEKVGKGQVLNNVSITASGTAAGDATTVTGGAYTAGATNSEIKLEGVGANTVNVASINAVKGKEAEVVLGGATSAAAQSLTVGGTANSLKYTGAKGADTLTIEGAVTNSAIDLGEGANSLTAERAGVGQALNNVSIKASGTGAGDATTITAGAYTAGATGNTIELGEGANSVTLKSIAAAAGQRASFAFGGSTLADAQSLTVEGAVSNLDYTGAKGIDALLINGAVANSKFALGDGNNTFEATKDDKDGVARGQALTGVSISAGAGDDTVVYGTYKPGKDATMASPDAFELGTGTDSIKMVA